ncbi:MAG: hypothetical protein WA194_06980 [Patescibacteria group bacterium]
MCDLSRKQIHIISGGILLLAAIAGGIFAAHEEFDHKRSKEWNDYRTEANEIGENVSRTVADTASGADITFTPTTSADSGALSELNAEFQILKGSALLQNTAFKADIATLSGSLKVSLTSNIPDVVKLIQEKAASGESGYFGIDLLRENNQSGGKKDGHGYGHKSDKEGEKSENRDGNEKERE